MNVRGKEVPTYKLFTREYNMECWDELTFVRCFVFDKEGLLRTDV